MPLKFVEKVFSTDQELIQLDVMLFTWRFKSYFILKVELKYPQSINAIKKTTFIWNSYINIIELLASTIKMLATYMCNCKTVKDLCIADAKTQDTQRFKYYMLICKAYIQFGIYLIR